MKLIKWSADKHIIYHAHAPRSGSGWARICLTQNGDKPDFAEEMDGKVKCSSCIRQSLEMTR